MSHAKAGKVSDEAVMQVKAVGGGSGQQSPQQQHINVRTLNVQEVRVLNHIQLGSVSLSSFSVQSLFTRMAAFERQAGKLQEDLKTLTDTVTSGGGGGGGGGDGGSQLPPKDTVVIQGLINNLQTQVDDLHGEFQALRGRVSTLEESYAAQQLFLNDVFEEIPTVDSV